MILKELNINEFNKFAVIHPLSNLYQTQEYALVMSELGFEYEFIGLYDDKKLKAASLILYKNIGNYKYGYAPKGFLIDYFDSQLLKVFTEEIRKYYLSRNFAFIKINPNIQIGKINNQKFLVRNENYLITDNLKTLGYNKLKDNLYFESLLPRYSPLIDLSNFSISSITKNTRNKVKKGLKKGLVFKKTDISDISYLDLLIHSKDFYYNDLYNVYNNKNNADLYIIYIDKEKFLENVQSNYINESENNHLLNEKMVRISHTKNINKKMNSDLALLSLKKDVKDAINLSKNSENLIVGAALVLKHNKTATLITSGYDKNYKRFAPNYFMHYNIINQYKKDFDYIDINGVSGDFSDESSLKGLNDFKLGFNPLLFENIGEFDLVISEKAYRILLRNGSIQKEFNKSKQKNRN